MKIQPRIVLFFVILAINGVGNLLHNQVIDYISKPLIVISLLIYFLFGTGTAPSPLKKWILAALVFSWAGDILLLFQQDGSIFFMTGLAAFLLAHVFYIIFFHLIKQKKNVRSRAWLLLPIAVYYAALISFLSPYLGDMKLPVRIYGIVISFMLLLAIHMLFIKNKTAGRSMMIGALLFVLSDSVLAINKFYQSFELAGSVIILTYGLAQFFIIKGATSYIRKN